MIDFAAIAPAVGAVGSALGGLLSSSKSGADISKATDTGWWAMAETSNAVQRAMDAYQNAYQTARGDLSNAYKGAEGRLDQYAQGGLRGFNALANALAPQGMTAVDQISGLPPGVGADIVNYLTQTPVYQFPYQEGLNALDRSASARGMLLSGQQQKAAQQYGQNFALSNALGPAMQNYQNYLRNIAGLGGMGLQAGTQIGQWGMQTGNALANVAMDTGRQYGQANLAQAGLQNALAGNIASSYTQQGLLDQAAGNRWSNALGSLIGTGIGAAGAIYNAGPWSQIGNSLAPGVNSGGMYGTPSFASRESGGPIKKGQPYLVGERGPEVVVPQENGLSFQTKNMRVSILEV